METTRARLDRMLTLTRTAVPAVSAGVAGGQLLNALLSASDTLDTATKLAVGILRQEGASWQEIGDLAGTTKQAAQQRFGPTVSRMT